ncbi:MAG: class I SAM-dependent methyltransferase [Cytophagales bacterium]
MEKKWYESWFDTHYYHLLYEHRNFEEADRFVQKMVAFLKLEKGSKVLDLACGKGRHSISLSKLGFLTTGIDLSVESILAAKEFENENLKFHQADMRFPVANEMFDVVFSLFSSFGYFESDAENEKVIESVAQMLKPRGRFVMDFLNTDVFENEFEEIQLHEKCGIQFKTHKKINLEKIVKEIEVNDAGSLMYFNEYLKRYNLSFFEKCFEKFSLRIENIFGDYELDDFKKNISPRLILIATKF